MPSSIFSATLSGNDNWGSSYNARVLLAAGLLSAAPAGATHVRVTIQSGSLSSAGSIDGVYIGKQDPALQPYNFDGNQVQLTFGGATSIPSVTGANTYVSDLIPFNYTNAVNLIVSVHSSGTNIDSLGTTGQTGCVTYYLAGTSQVGATAPTGTWGSNAAGRISWVSLIEMLSPPYVDDQDSDASNLIALRLKYAQSYNPAIFNQGTTFVRPPPTVIVPAYIDNNGSDAPNFMVLRARFNQPIQLAIASTTEPVLVLNYQMAKTSSVGVDFHIFDDLPPRADVIGAALKATTSPVQPRAPPSAAVTTPSNWIQNPDATLPDQKWGAS